jgi:two-component system, chemotaxis family, sensor kinase CheA
VTYPVDLRQQVEELALRLIVADPRGDPPATPWAVELTRLRDSAAREGAAQLADTVTALLGVLQRSGGNPSAELLEGITRLQQALDPAPSRADPAPPLSQDPELVGDFIVESREHLAAIESHLLTLERDPDDSETLNAVFRGFHTIKGLAGFLELWDVQKLAHETEALLDRARSSEATLNAAAIDVILESADHLRRWLSHLESGLRNQASAEPAANEPLLARLRTLTQSAAGVEPRVKDLANLAAGVAADRVAAPAPRASATESPAAHPSETTALRVNTAKLDYLVDMAGEMVIAESLVRHDPDLAAVKSQGLQRKMAQLTRITAELQKTAMAMRLVPIGPLFRRMSRMVRDLSRQFAKQVRLETEGDEIELDRTIVEELADPFIHMVRNALDHGIESPQERRERGKNPTACLLLKAHHQAGQVVIEIADDGRGLDTERIRTKAIQKDLIDPESALADGEIHNLIFHPGFSTAAQVTNISGRGVGMDVVRRHIEQLRGRIEIRSVRGQGTAFFLKLPLTLAIIDGLVVGVGAERFIVPLSAVREMFRPTPETLWTVQGRAEMALVRGSLLPVLRLNRCFGITPRSEDPLQSVLLVADTEGVRYGLLLDEVIGKQEVVIKSLGETFRGIPGIAGGAILGDGRVGLILDLERLMKDTDS